MQLNNGAGWFRPGHFRYKDTGDPFRGTPAEIKFADNQVKYFDGPAGREIIPAGEKEPKKEPTAAELFWLGF
jgi:hypothetical protein